MELAIMMLVIMVIADCSAVNYWTSFRNWRNK